MVAIPQNRARSSRLQQLIPALVLVILLGIIAAAFVQTGRAIAAGKELKDAIPVLETPIANFGKKIGAALTAWIPATAIATPFGPLDLKKTVSYTIYEWIKLPIILYLTTFGMTLLRLAIGTRRIERTLGRNDLRGIVGGVSLGMVTPVCSCTVTNLYAGLVAGGASRRASAAFLFASPALNEFAILFMFIAGGPLAGLLYLALGSVAAIATGYLSGRLGLDPARFVAGAITPQHEQPTYDSRLVHAHAETLRLFRRLLPAVLISGVLAGILVNFNLTLIPAMQNAGSAWWGPIVGTIIGLPLDINAASTAPILLGIAPIVPIGTLIAVMMATTVSSIPEVAMLFRLIGRRSTALVVAWYGSYVIAIGVILNAIFA